MIDLKELCLNNIVKVRHNGHWVTARVAAILKTYAVARNQYIHVAENADAEELHGCYVNVDWFVENGWHVESTVMNTSYLSEDFPSEMSKMLRIEFDTVANTFCMCFYDSATTTYRPISGEMKFIHQIQNLYYAITQRPLLTYKQILPILSIANVW